MENNESTQRGSEKSIKVSQFTKKLIEQYGIDIDNQSELLQNIELEDVEECSYFVREADREKFKAEINNFFYSINENNETSIQILQNNIGQQLKKYKIGDNDIKTQMENIKKRIFKHIIRQLAKKQKQQLSSNLNNIINQYKNKIQIQISEWLNGEQRALDLKFQLIMENLQNKVFNEDNAKKKLQQIYSEHLQNYINKFEKKAINEELITVFKHGKMQVNQNRNQRMNDLEQKIQKYMENLQKMYMHIDVKYNNKQMHMKVVKNGVEQLRQSLLENGYDDIHYGLTFENAKIHKLDEIFQSGKSKGTLILSKKVQIRCTFNCQQFIVIIQQDFKEMKIKQEIIQNSKFGAWSTLDENDLLLSFDGQESSKYQTIKQFKQLHNRYPMITVELLINITFCCSGQQNIFKMKSDETVKDLKNKIEKCFTQRKVDCLWQQNDGKKIKLTENIDSKLLSFCLNGENTLQIEPTLSASFQFYGFNQNYEQTFQQFQQFTVNSYNDLQETIKTINFSDFKEQQKFSKKLMVYLYSCIKKKFQIESVIASIWQKIGKLQNKIGIWTSKGKGREEGEKLNESFILMYLLSNSDDKLRIELMSLLKNIMPIPLYICKFKTIFDNSQTFQLNQQIFWVLQKGMTICSIGLHSQQKKKQKLQKGKTLLLNDIFYTNFCLSKSKHKIIQNVPYIYLQVYDDKFPINIIDVPRSYKQQQQCEKIIKMSDIVIVQSWRGEEETVKYAEELQKKYDCKKIVILRDQELSVSEDNEELNKCLENSQFIKLPVLLNQGRTRQLRVNKVRQMICQLLHRKKQLTNSQRIFNICTDHQFMELKGIIDKLQAENIDICKFVGYSSHLQIQKEDEKYDNKIAQLKQKKLNQNIENILKFFVKCKIPLKTALFYLRERLRSQQKQILKKYNKLYKIRKDIQNQNQVNEQKKHELQSLITELPLNQLKRLSYSLTDNKKQIIQKLDVTTSLFENFIKPNIFSIQLFWREIYSFHKFHPNNKINNVDLYEFIVELKSKEIMDSQPFQLIDGDFFEVQFQIFQKVFEAINENCLVVSILGPQSSGKSTLLNFLFGCDFSVSEGRCTRGLYGTYFRLTDSEASQNSSIFVIDTEGLFSVTNEKDKKQKERINLDSKLVLFCLAVSDFTIINVKGNFDRTTENLLKICHQKIVFLNKEDNKSEIVIVLNQNNSTRTSQSQTQFKSIRQQIKFRVYKSLPQAYKIKLITKQQICVLQNEVVDKKIPSETFHRQTQNLLNDMIERVEWKHCQKIQKKICNFKIIWDTVTGFSNLSRLATKEQRELQIRIKQWKKRKQEEYDLKIKEMIQKYEKQEIEQLQVSLQVKKFYHAYQAQFDEQYNKIEESAKTELMQRVKKQKQAIISKKLQNMDQIRYKIEENKVKKTIQQQQWEGDQQLRKIEQQIIINQKNNIKQYDDKEKEEMFNNCWKQSIQKLSKAITSDTLLKNKLVNIKNCYLFLIQISDNRQSQFGLPDERNSLLKLEDIKSQNLQEIQKLLTTGIYEKINCHERFMAYINKPHTIPTEDGLTDAKKKYLDVAKKYLKKEMRINFVILPKKSIVQHFKLKNFRRLKKIAKKQQLSEQTLPQIVKFLAGPVKKIKRFMLADRNEIAVEMADKIQQNAQQNNKNYSFMCNQSDQGDNDRQPKSSESLQQMMYKKKKQEKMLNHIDSILCQKINKDLENINAKISANTKIYKILHEKMNQRQMTQKIFQSICTVNQNCAVKSKQEVNNKIKELKYFDGKNLQSKLRINQQKCDHQQIIIGSIKLQCMTESQEFKGYMKQSKNIIKKFKNDNNFKKQIYVEMKKESIGKFLHQIFKIIKNTILKWQGDITNGTIQQIFSLVNAEICTFNNDLTQISHRLSDKIVGQVHLMTIYMIWKYQVDNLIKKQHQILKRKTLNKTIEFSNFMIKTSDNLNQITKLEVQQFMDAVLKKFEEMVVKVKNKMRDESIAQFKKKVSRKEILQNIDTCIFTGSNNNQMILDYLQNPSRFIQEKYEECYEQSFKNVQHQLNGKKYDGQVWDQFQKTISQMLKVIVYNGIKQESGDVRNLFEIVSNLDSVLIRRNEAEQKKMLFQYFMDKTLNNGKQMMQRTIANFRVQPIKKLASTQAPRGLLKQILENINKDEKLKLKMTNLPKFLYVLQNNKSLKSSLSNVCKFKQEQKIHFFNKIRVIVCKQVCPCCNRICGEEEVHQLHKCKFGHQMRALAGSYIKVMKNEPCSVRCKKCDCKDVCGNEQIHKTHKFKCSHQEQRAQGEKIRQRQEKEAFVQRCQQISQTQLMEYNGNRWTWNEFKKYWKQKAVGGWVFDDISSEKEMESNKKRFAYAWNQAGPLYCKKQKMKFVSFNDLQLISKKQMDQNFHFVLLLDQSGSMKGERWDDLLIVLKSVLQKMTKSFHKQKGQNVVVSVINFSAEARIIHERAAISEINVDNIPFIGEGTNFAEAFAQAYKVANKYVQQEKIVIMFMSDGQSIYPKKEIEQIKSLMGKNENKIFYFGLFLGLKTQSQALMNKMKDQLNGKNFFASNFEQLLKAYEECVEIMKRQKNK